MSGDNQTLAALIVYKDKAGFMFYYSLVERQF